VTRPAPDTQAIGPNAEARGHDPAAGHPKQDHGHRHGHGRPHGHGAGHHPHHDGDCHGHRGGHHHDHGHGHHHGVAPRLAGDALSRAFAWAVALNVGFVIAEFAFGLWANSTALLADAAVSLGVVVSGVAMALTGWYRLDPIVTLAIVGVIAWSTWGLLREAVAMSLNAVPAHLDPAEVARYLAGQPGVAGVHDLHVWSLSTTDCAMTAHLVMPAGHPGDAALDALAAGLLERFGIGHATLQVEYGTTDHGACALQERGDRGHP
jgi:Co/Zn/Cd efflux system component